MAATGCVIFAKNVSEMAQFYRTALKLVASSSDDSHQVLSNDTLELVIHSIPIDIAHNITIESPPVSRSNTAIKPIYMVESLEELRAVCDSSNGGLKPVSEMFEIRNVNVLDGWDPEGNVIQFRQISV